MSAVVAIRYSTFDYFTIGKADYSIYFGGFPYFRAIVDLTPNMAYQGYKITGFTAAFCDRRAIEKDCIDSTLLFRFVEKDSSDVIFQIAAAAMSRHADSLVFAYDFSDAPLYITPDKSFMLYYRCDHETKVFYAEKLKTDFVTYRCAVGFHGELYKKAGQ